MAFGDFLFGTPATTEQFPRFGQQQQQSINQLISSLQGNLQSPTSGFQPIVSAARSGVYVALLGSGGAVVNPVFGGIAAIFK